MMWMQVHGRRAILEQVVSHHADIDCLKFAVCSTEEEAEFMNEHGWYSYVYENRPLGKKSDMGIRAALQIQGWDYLVQINSDDFLSPKYWKAIKPLMERNIEAAGIKAIYFVDSYTLQAKMMRYQSEVEGRWYMGAARLFRRDVIDKTIEATGCFWDWHINRALDLHSERRVINAGFNFEEIESTKPLVMDLKSNENIWAFTAYTRERHGAVEVDFNEVKKQIEL
jgi:hypothetical protein